ncbi:MAG: SGNH/GDSL hydrolase family protein [Luteolibacter sp.]|uniref:SGNH/GDSL hydrolase family protein n=1 Tax=Luteolibacter sp. TaxID=1962973 RepID=UPI0032647A8A
MKPTLLLPFILALQPLSATEQVVTLGDSLTFAYETEFGHQVENPFGPDYGDGFSSRVRNWAEILNKSGQRRSSFHLGPRQYLSIEFPGGSDYDFFLRNRNNWAVPGLRIHELWKFMNHKATMHSMIDPDLADLLDYTDFDESTDFAVGDLEDQIRNTAERVVIFIGGNDVRGVYPEIYNNDNPGDFVSQYVLDATRIVDRVLELNPHIQVVLVNVPHVGITPRVKSKWPTDPVKTPRVSRVLRDLNDKLENLAKSRDIGYADVYSPTLSMLWNKTFCIQGIPYANDGSTTGKVDHVWLNGPSSDNFHPNTNLQAVIANQIIDAFNVRYDTRIAPLSATEILVDLLGKTPDAIDMSFSEYMSAYGKEGLPANDDSDGDGIPASVEFATGLNPKLQDSDQIFTIIRGNNRDFSYPIRLPDSKHFTLRAIYSSGPGSQSTPITPDPTTGSDGYAHVILPVTDPGTIHLHATIR